jgi:hypothetical protein
MASPWKQKKKRKKSPTHLEGPRSLTVMTRPQTLKKKGKGELEGMEEERGRDCPEGWQQERRMGKQDWRAGDWGREVG